MSARGATYQLLSDADLPTKSRFKTFTTVLKECNISPDTSIKILLTGRAGRGKSTLINNIIEDETDHEIAKVGDGIVPGTNDVQTIIDSVNGTEVTLVDTPGLQDSHSSSSFFNNLVEDMMRYGNGTSIVFYCMKMTDIRLDADEVKAIQQFYQAFGRKFWERVIIVLTFANQVTSHTKRKAGDPPIASQEWKNIKKERFVRLLKKKRNDLIQELEVRIPMPSDVAGKIKIVPVGDSVELDSCPEPMRLAHCDDWLHDLLDLCCMQTDCLTLSKLHLEENLHLAIVIDNEYDENDKKKNDDKPRVESSRVSLIKEALYGFMVLSFKDLSLELMEKLVSTITTEIDSMELAAFAFIVLGKKKACDEFNFEKILSKISSKFAKVPKILTSHFIMTKKTPLLASPILPPNTVLCTIFSEKNDEENKFANILKEKFTINKEVFENPNCFEEIKNEILQVDNWSCGVFSSSNSVLPSLYEPHVIKASLALKKKKVDILRKIWRIVRSDTVDELIAIKDEIRKIIQSEHTVSLLTKITGIVAGGGLVVGGIVAAPFTLGTSIGLSVAGGVLGVAAGMGGLGAKIAEKLMENHCLKKAQAQIAFDQQCSEIVNKFVAEYYEVIQRHLPEIALSSSTPDASTLSSGVSTTLSAVSRAGMATAFGIAEGAVEGGAFALRTTGRIAGIALAGVSLAVTVPIDLAFIAYHSYRIHRFKQDKSGEKDDDVKSLIEQIKALFIDTIQLDKHDHSVESQVDKFSSDGFLIQLTVPNCSISIYTIFCGPFDLPTRTTLASAVYGVIMIAESGKEIPLNLEHCVDTTSSYQMQNTKFAIGTLDIIQKKCVFTLLPPGRGMIKKNCGEISIDANCFLCIVYEKQPEEYIVPLKYAAHYSCTKDMKNTWNIKIVFTKNLKAHSKLVKREFPVNATTFKNYPFKFTSVPLLSVIQLETKQFSSSSISRRGWTIKHQSNCSTSELPTPEVIVIAKKKDLDTIEIKVELSECPSKAIPSIDLCVEAADDASDNLDYILKFKGANLEIPIKLDKES